MYVVIQFNKGSSDGLPVGNSPDTQDDDSSRDFYALEAMPLDRNNDVANEPVAAPSSLEMSVEGDASQESHAQGSEVKQEQEPEPDEDLNFDGVAVKQEESGSGERQAGSGDTFSGHSQDQEDTLGDFGLPAPPPNRGNSELFGDSTMEPIAGPSNDADTASDKAIKVKTLSITFQFCDCVKRLLVLKVNISRGSIRVEVSGGYSEVGGGRWQSSLCG